MTEPSTGRPEALVTGASSGIGAATCRRLRAGGWRVVGVARRPSPEADLGLEIDVTCFQALVEAFRDIPRLRLLVHGAATVNPVASFAESDPTEWQRAVEVNLVGTYNVLRAALGSPFRRNGGIAIHLTSGAASRAKPYWSAYSASKAGAEHLVRSVAADVTDADWGVCALDPGITETPMQEQVRGLDFPDRDRFVRTHEAGEGRSPEEVAAAICELAAREPREVNGRTFRVGAL